jgi:sphingosine kinase
MVALLNQIIFEAELRCLAPGMDASLSPHPPLGYLTAECLTWVSQGIPQSLPLRDLLSISEGDPRLRGAGLPVDIGFYVYACPVQSGASMGQRLWSRGAGARHRQFKTFHFLCANPQAKMQWITAIQAQMAELEEADPINQQSSHWIVFLNPESGQRQASQLLTQVKPIFDQRKMRLSMVELAPGMDLTQRIAALDLEGVKGLISVGGDGTTYQIINGLMARRDWQTAIQLPLGLFPAGTSNGLCKTILEALGEAYHPINAAFLIAKGRPYPLDMLKVTQEFQVHYGLLSLSWGLVSDIDLGSDRLRWLGPLRTNLLALYKILRRQLYRGRLALQPNLEADDTLMESDYVTIWAMNVAWAAHNVKAAPQAERNDGKMDILIIRQQMSRWQLLRAFLKTSTGEHVDAPQIEYYKIAGLSLDPIHPLGMISLDGEALPTRATRIEVMPGLGRIISGF